MKMTCKCIKQHTIYKHCSDHRKHPTTYLCIFTINNEYSLYAKSLDNTIIGKIIVDKHIYYKQHSQCNGIIYGKPHKLITKLLKLRKLYIAKRRYILSVVKTTPIETRNTVGVFNDIDKWYLNEVFKILKDDKKQIRKGLCKIA